MEELYILQYSPQKYLLQVFKQIELRGLVQGVNRKVQDNQEDQDHRTRTCHNGPFQLSWQRTKLPLLCMSWLIRKIQLCSSGSQDI